MPAPASPDQPLSGLAVATAAWPAAREAGRLLQALGATVREVADGPAVHGAGASVDAPPTTTAQDWAESGAMTLTGRADGPPLHTTGSPATAARAAALAVEWLSALGGQRISVDGALLLGERAAVRGFARRGDVSAGGGARLLPTADGWVALNLARAEDVELVPALTGDLSGAPAWESVGRWAAGAPARAVEERAVLLGLPVGVPRPPGRAPAPWTATAVRPAVPRDRPLRVVDLGSLWAAPLCARLLRLAGASVVDVESVHRPDGARLGDPAFYGLLHAGNELVRLDLTGPAGRAALLELVRDADVVLEASRPAALPRLGVVAAEVMASGRCRAWVRITGHGRGTGADRVGFGDDAAVAAGLVGRDDAGPVFAGDAIADPLTGLHAAVAALGALHAGGGWLLDLSLRDVAARSVAAGPTSGDVRAALPRLLP